MEDPRIARLKQLTQEFQQYPGAAPGGTGATGLRPDDAQGYSDLLNRRIEYQQLTNPKTQVFGDRDLLEAPSDSNTGRQLLETSAVDNGGGPFGQFGAGTGGIQPEALLPSTTLAGLKAAAKPVKKTGIV
jgi:hypothetical protein